MTLPAAGDCVLISTADWNARYWTNKQHMAERLAARGWRVLYVESVGLRSPDIRSVGDWRRLVRRLFAGLRDFFLGPRQVAPSIWVLSPLVLPGRRYAAIDAVNRLLLDHPVLGFVRRHFRRPIVWTYHPFMLSLAERIGQGPLVYHCVDDIAAIPGVDITAMRRCEPLLLAAADAVFTTSEPLFEKCVAINANTHFFSNVADADHFGAALRSGPVPADIDAIPRPRLGYHGVLSDFKMDFRLLVDLAGRRPDWHIVLIGDEREGQTDASVAQLARLPNVHLLGYRPYERLPDYLRGIDVGLLPIMANDYTHSMFPMKLYEYLAAGVPVVSTPGPFVADGPPRVQVAADLSAFIAAVEAQLAAGRLTPDEARKAVGRNTWDERLDRMLAIVARVPERGAREA
jgi:glycosyltransferase involved in cell wall biosynthesis